MTPLASIAIRCYLLLGLLTLLAASWLLKDFEQQPISSQFRAGFAEQKVQRSLVIFGQKTPQPFRQLPLAERARYNAQLGDELLLRIGYRSTPPYRFRYSRGLVLDLDARQFRRLARQRSVLLIEAASPGVFRAGELPQDHVPKQSPDSLSPQSPTGKRHPASPQIAVLDSGIDGHFHHSAAYHLPGVCFCSRGMAGCCSDNAPSSVSEQSLLDRHGHGTSVSALLLETVSTFTDKPTPIGLVTARVLDDSLGICCPADIVAALDWLAHHYPALLVVNASMAFGTRNHGICDSAGPHSFLLADAVSALSANGTIVVAASGNDEYPDRIGLPGCLSEVISVGAVYARDYPEDYQPERGCRDKQQRAGQVTCFSNTAHFLDLLAPGAYFELPGLEGELQSMLRGTSFSAPVVSGCIAALRQAHPHLDRTGVLDVLTRTGEFVEDRRSGLRFPVLDCAAAMTALKADQDSIQP